MESQLSFLAIAFSLFMLLHWLANYCKPKTKLPPGPRKLPIIGNLHQLAAASSPPHQTLQKLAKKYGPLMHLQLGEVSAVVATSPRLAMEITKTHDLAFGRRPQLLVAKALAYGPSDLIFAPCGDTWRQLKKLVVLELLSSKRVQSFSYIREDETAKFIESIRESAGSPVNLTSRISSLVSDYLARAAFGDRTKDRDEFVQAAKIAVEMAGGFYLADLFPSIKPLYYITGMKSKVEKLQRQTDRILGNIVAEHQEKQIRARDGRGGSEREDLVDVLLKVQQSSGLENDEITIRNTKALVLDIFLAGTDTTASTLAWAMSEMVRNPRVREKAQDELRQAFKGKKIIHESDLEELSYLKLVMKETLRLHGPIPLLLPRECTEHTTIDGYDIPANTRVMVNMHAISRDPQYWPDPEKFIPERFDGISIDFKGNNFEYLPFGAGRRICPGITFGLASIALPLALLLYHFNWELPNGMKPEDLDMSECFGLGLSRKSVLRLVPTVYDPPLYDGVHFN